MSLAKTIQTLRKQRGLSQVALAERLDVVQSSVADWERGKTHPRYNHLRALARVLRTTVSKLVEAA